MKKLITGLLPSFAMVLLMVPMAANAATVTIGDLSGDDSTNIITDSLNDLEWLRWDVIANLNYADTLTYAENNGWSVAGVAEAQLFVNAMFGTPSCIVALGQTFAACGNVVGLQALTGDNFTPSGDDAAWFLTSSGGVGFVYYRHSSQPTGEVSVQQLGFTIATADSFGTVQWLLYRDIDTDGDGVLNSDDLCPDSVIPEVGVPSKHLAINRWALFDDDLEFDTTSPPGQGPTRSYSTTDTGGCSCKQIIAAQGLGRGHTMFGCSISAMDDWVLLLVNP